MSDSTSYINGFIEYCEKSGFSTTQAAALYELDFEKRAQQGEYRITDFYTDKDLGLDTPFNNPPSQQKPQNPNYQGPLLTEKELKMTPRERAAWRMRQRGVNMPSSPTPKTKKPYTIPGGQGGGSRLDNAPTVTAYGVTYKEVKGANGKTYRVPSNVEKMTQLDDPEFDKDPQDSNSTPSPSPQPISQTPSAPQTPNAPTATPGIQTPGQQAPSLTQPGLRAPLPTDTTNLPQWTSPYSQPHGQYTLSPVPRQPSPQYTLNPANTHPFGDIPQYTLNPTIRPNFNSGYDRWNSLN